MKATMALLILSRTMQIVISAEDTGTVTETKDSIDTKKAAWVRKIIAVSWVALHI